MVTIRTTRTAAGTVVEQPTLLDAPTQALEVGDMQGLLVSSYIHLPCAAFRILTVVDRLAAGRWLAAVTADVTTAAGKQDGWSLNLALTWPGLAALGLPSDALATFSAPFIDGMASPRRSRILGDGGTDDPRKWRWGGPTSPAAHIIQLLYASDAAELTRQLARWPADVASGVQEAMTFAAGREPDTKENFGFADGIGQPVIAGSGRETTQLRRTQHATLIPAGDFVLGYPNAYGLPSPSPSVMGSADPAGALPVAADAGRHDLGRNGSYLVYRQLGQDVAGFWQRVRALAATYWPDDPGAVVRLASKFVGRWPSGAPLVGNPKSDPFNGEPQEHTDNNFSYAETDPYGKACPVGAHIRRSNPRDSLPPDAATSLTTSNRHRLLRRGRSYGPRIADPFADDGQERGLHFICLNADLERQFEFVQQTWLNNPVFGVLPGETDPLTGDQASATGAFTVQGDPLRTRVRGVRSFVSTRGGAYCFLPGIRALRWLGAMASAGTSNADQR
jgi:Dyp-type peroxidase family